MTLTTPHHDGLARQSYDRFADHYDAFTAGYDSDTWLEGLLAAAKGVGLRGKRVLDVACGTGNSFLPLHSRGWQITACDISEAMLARARGKAPAEVNMFQADMRDLPRVGEFDLVACLGDAVNYLDDTGELAACFHGYRRNLAAGGLALFDVNTLQTYRSFFAETQTREVGEHRLIWKGLGDATFAPGAHAEATFEVVGAIGDEVVVPASIHRQRHFLASEIEEAVEEAGLTAVAVFGHGLDGILEQPPNEERHTKAVYICSAHPHGEGR
jgi:SAM-dependent methyltransferase